MRVPVFFLLFVVVVCPASVDRSDIPAVRIAGQIPGTGNEKDRWEVTAAFTDAKDEAGLSRSAAALIESALLENPNIPIQIVTTQEGSPSLTPANEEAKKEAIEFPKSSGIEIGKAGPSSLASWGSRLAERFKGVRHYYAEKVRPKLPFSPRSPSDTSPESLMWVGIKGVTGGVATGLVLLATRQPVDYSTEFLLQGLSFAALQASLAAATAVRNTEILDFITDKNWIRARGIKESGFLGLKRDAKYFATGVLLLSLTKALSFGLGLSSTPVDILKTGIAAGISTAIAKGWTALMTEHLPPGNPWRTRIPYFMFAAAQVGNLAAILHGPLNATSLIAWGTVGLSGFAAYYALKGKDAIRSFARKMAPSAANAAPNKKPSSCNQWINSLRQR